MSNKQQLQTNNANLDAFITRVNAAKDVAASLPDAGGGGDSSYEIGTFTVDGDNIYPQGTPTPNPFIVGMTWEEFVNSPLNFIRYNGQMPTSYAIYNEQIKIRNSVGLMWTVTTNGELSGAVKPSDVISPINYSSYSGGDGSGGGY